MLPESFATDPERIARFEREAKTLASLNHPNVAQIYGIEARALVMELVEGEDLAERLMRGPMPLDDALDLARQIVDALEVAHDRGIIHRDLKPANIKVRSDGTVKAGGAWGTDGRIVFTTGFSGLLEVSDRGGDVRVALPIDPATDLDFHEAIALPDRRGVLFYVHGRPGSPTGLAVFDGTQRRMVLHEEGLVLDHPAYSPTGHLLYRRSPTNAGIWAVPFSLDTLATAGEPFLVVPGQYMPSVARDGTLVYAPGGSGLARPARLTWVDRAGTLVGSIGDPEPGLQFPVLSRDGSRVAVATTDGVIWVYDIVNETRARLTLEPGLALDPVWLPDGDRLVYVARSSFDSGLPHLVVRGLDGAVTLSTLAEGQKPDVSADGRHIDICGAQEGKSLSSPLTISHITFPRTCTRAATKDPWAVFLEGPSSARTGPPDVPHTHIAFASNTTYH